MEQRNFFHQTFQRLPPVIGANVEGRLFTLAGRHVDAYKGGSWESIAVGNFYFPVLPAYIGDRVELNSPNGCRIVCTRQTAGAALALMAINHEIWRLDDRKSPHIDTCIEYYDALRELLRAPDATFDAGQVLEFLD